MSSDLINANYAGWAAGALSAYAYLLDYATSPAASTATYGLRFTGATVMNTDAKLLYTAEFAQQSDYADTPANFDLNYLFAELGGSLRGITAKLGYEVLEGNGTQSVQTPLATLHAFNGWVDQFLATPAAGLEDKYLGVGGTAWGVDWLAVYHDYSANQGDADYGTEWKFQALKKFNKIYMLTAKYAAYSAGDLAGKVDTDKWWLVAQMAFCARLIMKLIRGTLVRCPFFRLVARLAVSALIWIATPTAQRDFGAAATRARGATVMSMQSHAVKSLLSACLAAAPCHHGNWYGSCPC